ncbi:hypothetical protein V5F49_05025 [Xanthobacter sp. V3C-3]|uniref:hypothetical protein n=1 Tax=Xanthobacter lutulentifluminis TaxID=3119935 RepID=UPI00372CD212
MVNEKRPPPHVLNALRLRKELAALIRSRIEAGKEPPPAAGLAHVIPRLAVVLDRDGPTLPGVRRAARALGAGDLPAEMALPEIRRAAAEGKLGQEWRLPSADALGLLLGVDEAERARLDLRLIGSRDVTAADRRRAADRVRKARTRAEAGATPRHAALSSTKPWEAAGVSRATYFRRQKKMDETISSASPSIKYQRADEIVSQAKASDGAPALVALAMAHPSRAFEPAPPGPPVLPGSIRDRAMRSAILPHPRVMAALKAAAGPMQIADLAPAADIRREACRLVVGDLAACGLVDRIGREHVAVSASIASLRSEAAISNA